MIAFCETHQRSWFKHIRDNTCVTTDEHEKALELLLENLRTREKGRRHG